MIEFYGRKLYNTSVFEWGELAKEYIPHFMWYRDVKKEDTGEHVRARWCSYCGCFNELDKNEIYDIYIGYHDLATCKHQTQNLCPCCGYPVTFINENKMTSYNSLTRVHRIIFSDYIDFDHVIFYACRVMNYPDRYYEEQFIQIEPSTCYELSPGSVKMYRYDGEKWVQRKNYGEPYQNYFGHGGDYQFAMLGHELDLKGTFLQYFHFHEFENVGRSGQTFYGDRYYFYMTFLCDCCMYPQLEFLMKNDCYSIVYDLVYGRNFNRQMLNWKAENYVDFFGIKKSDVKPFIDCNLSLYLLKLYHQNGKRISLSDICLSFQGYSSAYFEQLLELCNLHGIDIGYLNKYFNAHMIPRDRHNSRIYDSTFQMWRDYVQACEKLDIDLSDRHYLFPSDLPGEHDKRVEQLRVLEDKNLVKMAAKSLARRDRQYRFEDDNFIIYVPHTPEELVAEGRMQDNCVSTHYTQRHFRDVTTICFLRDKRNIDESFYTIEICNRTVHQKHGYLNDLGHRANTPEKKEKWVRFLGKPRAEADAFYRKWLAWVQSGSPRDVYGNPITESKKEKRKQA